MEVCDSMSHHDEFLPDRAIVDELINQAILPLLRSLEQDLPTPLTADVIVVAGGVEAPPIRISTGHGLQGDSLPRQPNGQIHVMFRRTYNPNRHRFFLESIFPGLSSTTGFSGFSSKGDVKILGDVITVNPTFDGVRYNVWEWQGWT
jgi:hypothetical protein